MVRPTRVKSNYIAHIAESARGCRQMVAVLDAPMIREPYIDFVTDVFVFLKNASIFVCTQTKILIMLSKPNRLLSRLRPPELVPPPKYRRPPLGL